MSTDESGDIPSYGKLPGGMSLGDVAEAIELSGYPLQADVVHVITDVVKGEYNLIPRYQEEWTYVDSDSGQVRSVDIFAGLNFARRFDNRTREELEEGPKWRFAFPIWTRDQIY